MILDSPTIFGMSGSSLLAGGEAGAEAVVGVSSLQAMIQNAVASQTGTMVNALSAAREKWAVEVTSPFRFTLEARCLMKLLLPPSSGWRSGQEADDGIYTIFKY